jgi:hypothetical protein
LFGGAFLTTAGALVRDGRTVVGMMLALVGPIPAVLLLAPAFR